MPKKQIFTMFIILLLFTEVKSQSQYGTWTSFSFDIKAKNWKFDAEAEVRTIYYVRLISRGSLALNAEYKIIKPLRVGFQYQLMNNLDEKYLNYQLRNRFTGYLEAKKKFGDFDFSLKESIVLTTKDESKRIRIDGSIDTYAINPAWKWKNTIGIEYDIPKCKLTPGFEFSSYFQLNNSDGNQFDKLRYSLSLKYRINKHNTIKAFGLINSELDNDDEEYSGKYILGFKYTYSY